MRNPLLIKLVLYEDFSSLLKYNNFVLNFLAEVREMCRFPYSNDISMTNNFTILRKGRTDQNLDGMEQFYIYVH